MEVGRDEFRDHVRVGGLATVRPRGVKSGLLAGVATARHSNRHLYAFKPRPRDTPQSFANKVDQTAAGVLVFCELCQSKNDIQKPAVGRVRLQLLREVDIDGENGEKPLDGVLKSENRPRPQELRYCGDVGLQEEKHVVDD